MHDDAARDHLSDPGLAGVEQIDGLTHDLRGRLVARLDLASPLPELFDLPLQVCHPAQVTRASI